MDCAAPETYLLTSRKYSPLFVLNSEMYQALTLHLRKRLPWIAQAVAFNALLTIRNIMRSNIVVPSLIAVSLLAMTPVVQADSKSLVFCSEGSPAGFDIGQYTSGTDNDAAEPIYNRLAEFARGETSVVPALATSWDLSLIHI